MMLKVLSKLSLGKETLLTVEDSGRGIKIGDTVKDEKGNIFTVKSVGMPHFETPEHWGRMICLLISGDGFSGESITAG